MIKEYKITKHNSSVNGDLGNLYDWTKFDWEGNEIKIDKCPVKGCDHRHEYKAYPAYVDGKGTKNEYLHVPYNWSEWGTVYRIYANNSISAGKTYRGHLIKAVKAVKKADGWYWSIEME